MTRERELEMLRKMVHELYCLVVAIKKGDIKKTIIVANAILYNKDCFLSFTKKHIKNTLLKATIDKELSSLIAFVNRLCKVKKSEKRATNIINDMVYSLQVNIATTAIINTHRKLAMEAKNDNELRKIDALISVARTEIGEKGDFLFVSHNM